MIFVPLPLFASLFLTLALIWFLRNRDMSLRPHQIFAALVAAYCVQSTLLSLRWGYDITAVGPVIAALAPVLPVLSWLAYTSLSGQRPRRWWLPFLAVALCWIILIVSRDLADLGILTIYVVFGVLLLLQARKGDAGLALSPVFETRQILLAMALTGTALILSGLMDVYVIYDFIRNDGANVGLMVSLVQTVFVLMIGLAATFGHTTLAPVEPAAPAPPQAQEQEDAAETEAEDTEILNRLTALFDNGLHRDEDLSLRKMARRLGVPDRRVSNAINRAQGINVSQYVNEFRIRDACTLLRTTDQSILQISITVGFASKSNFNREFVRVTGDTPSDWRKQQEAAAPQTG